MEPIQSDLDIVSGGQTQAAGCQNTLYSSKQCLRLGFGLKNRGYLCDLETRRLCLTCNFGVSLPRQSQLKHWLNVTVKIKSKRHEDRAGRGERESDGGSMRVGQPESGSSGGIGVH